MSAYDLEGIVIDRLRAFLSDGAALHAAIVANTLTVHEVESALGTANDAALALGKRASHERAMLLINYISRVRLNDGSVEIDVRRSALLPRDIVQSAADDTVVLSSETARVRRGHEVRLIIPASRPEPVTAERDAGLVHLIAESHAARALVMASPERSIDQIASAQGRCRTHLSRLVKLSYLAPDIVTAILEGRQPAALNRRRLMVADLPLSWIEQREALGCA